MKESKTELLIRANREVKPINDPVTIDKMLAILIELPAERQSNLWIRDTHGAGQVCLFTHPNFPGYVVEYVAGSDNDSVSSLYQANPVFNDRSALARLRNELMQEIGAATLSLPSAVAFYDHGRERDVRLPELGTAQLIDSLAKAINFDLSAA